MGFPHPTVDVPGLWPLVCAEVSRVIVRDDLAERLVAGLGGDESENRGHVCATAWVVDPTGSHTLLVAHPELGWSTPGGHVERHETSRGAALRELEEETGLTRFDVRPLRDDAMFVHVTDRHGDRPHRHWNVAWGFVADMEAPLSPVESARWWPVDSLPDGPSDRERLLPVVVGILGG